MRHVRAILKRKSTDGDNSPIGIILVGRKTGLLIKYTLHGISSQLFVNRVPTVSSNREELRAEVEPDL